MGFIPKPHLMLMTSANFTQKLSAFLFHRKYVVALKCKSTVVSYEIKSAPRRMRTSRKGRKSQATPLGRVSVRQAHTLFSFLRNYLSEESKSVVQY